MMVIRIAYLMLMYEKIVIRDTKQRPGVLFAPGLSLRKIREELWKVHEAQILDQRTGEVHVMQMDTGELTNSLLEKIGVAEFSH
jgi:hypothetical protein